MTPKMARYAGSKYPNMMVKVPKSAVGVVLGDDQIPVYLGNWTVWVGDM